VAKNERCECCGARKPASEMGSNHECLACKVDRLVREEAALLTAIAGLEPVICDLVPHAQKPLQGPGSVAGLTCQDVSRVLDRLVRVRAAADRGRP
jgi:hypothetical protein